MADKLYTNTNTNARIAHSVGFLALIIALLSLVTAVAAYNRTGQSVTQAVANQVSSAASATALTTARATAATKLAAIRTRVIVGQASTEIADEVAAIRNDLRQAYANTTGTIRTEYDQLETELQGIENGIRQGTADVLNLIEAGINRLEEEVRS